MATSTGAVKVVVEEDGAEKSAKPTHTELREMCRFTSVNMELPPDKEELGSIDKVDKWGFVLVEATEFGGWKVQGRGGCTPAKKDKKEPPRYGPEVVEGATNLNAQKIT